jgi:hypothetical protein
MALEQELPLSCTTASVQLEARESFYTFLCAILWGCTAKSNVSYGAEPGARNDEEGIVRGGQ